MATLSEHAQVLSMNAFKEAYERIGRLSKPSKMPCYSWSIPAKYCQTGGILAEDENSVCAVCYAMKGFYLFKAAADAMERRWQILQHALSDRGAASQFVEDFTTVLEYYRTRTRGATYNHFRWFDSGDLCSREHLQLCVDIAEANPEIKFWLPTKEYRIVGNYPRDRVPSNLAVRVSAALINGKAPDLGYPVSVANTHRDFNDPSLKPCVAPEQDGKCLDCRACWVKDDPRPIIYEVH